MKLITHQPKFVNNTFEGMQYFKELANKNQDSKIVLESAQVMKIFKEQQKEQYSFVVLHHKRKN